MLYTVYRDSSTRIYSITHKMRKSSNIEKTDKLCNMFMFVLHIYIERKKFPN